MPTVERWRGHRFYFYSHEPNEPPHVHVDYQGATAKFWLTPPSLAANAGFPARDLTYLLGYIRLHRERFLEAWHGYFGA